MNENILRRSAAHVLILFLACSCHGLIKSAPAVPPAPAQPQAQWDRVFERHSGWTGADVAASFIIPGNRVLWLFGDSFVGEVDDNRHVRAAMVHNSIAVHPYDPARPGEPPDPDDAHFYWGPTDASGRPTAWLEPTPHADPAADTWYWPTGGAVVFPGPRGTSSLALFLIQLENKEGDGSVWSFQTIANAMAMVADASMPAAAWDPRVIELPRSMEKRSGATEGPAVEW